MNSKIMQRCLVALAGAVSAIAAWGAYTEAPELRRLVEAGKLPPLDQRLPSAPLVITPLEKPGVYGGTWQMALVGYDNNSLPSRSMAYEQLVRWDPNWTRVLPNIASNWTVNADATVYRFHLRRGMRWSDGEPYTAHDIVAWVDDVARDPELSPVAPPWLIINSLLPECTAPDDFTVEFRFASSNAIFIEQLAGMRAGALTHYPAHYFRKMHRRHDPAGAAELMRRTGLAWSAAFKTICSPTTWRQVGVPTIDAWTITDAYVPGAHSLNAVRNPYYWKIDTLGRQLPYLDAVRFDIVENSDEVQRRAIAGQVDYQRESINLTERVPGFKESVQAGKIVPIRQIPCGPGPIVISLNLTHPDPLMRAALGNKEVRIALSEAINRREIIAQLYGHEGTSFQIAPKPDSPFYNRRLGTQYTDYTPERSKARLDAVGLSARGAVGLRHLPDGRPFRIHLLVPKPGQSDWIVILNQIKSDWLAVGVAMDWTLESDADFLTQVGGNQADGSVWWCNGGYAPVLDPEYFVPVTFDRDGAVRVSYAVAWAKWFINPQAPGAEEPPASVEKQIGLFRQVVAESNRDTRFALMRRVLEMAADEFYVMGICLDPGTQTMRSSSFHNVPSSHFISWLYPDPGPFNPCQFFHATPAP